MADQSRRVRRADGEAGSTLTEVLVVLAISSLLSVPLLALLTTTSRVERDRADSHTARIELDSAMRAIGAELITATPVSSRPAGTTAVDTLGVVVVDAAADETLVYWTADNAGLTRIEADPDTLRVLGRSTVSTRVVAADGAPFRYYDATGAELVPATVGAQRLADCTTLVEISLAVEVGDGQEIATSRQAIRTRPPGSNGC